MVQLFKVIVLMSVVLVLAWVGIMHQVSWSPGQLFLHSHLQIGKKKQVFVNILIFYCWFSGPPWTRRFYFILHSLVRKIGSFWDFARKSFQRYSQNRLYCYQTSYLSFCLHTDFLRTNFSSHRFGTKWHKLR